MKVLSENQKSLAELKLWSNMEFKGREKKLKWLIEKLRVLKEGFSHYEQGDEIKRVEHRIDNILLDEEILWKQRSRVD